MKIHCIQVFVLVMALIFLTSCTTPPKAEHEAAPKKPEMTIQIASINLANINRRIDRSNIGELAKILKKEQIEVLAVQGISRYPGVTTRVDFVNELSAKTDWRNAFGEMQNISGRQTGNAIFSVYPILSHQNFSWDVVKSSSFEAALQATIDAGSASLIVVSTELPQKATASERAQCIKMMAALNPDTSNRFTIVTGNLSADEAYRTANAFAEVLPPEPVKSTNSKIWYTETPLFQLLSSRSMETGLGTLMIAQFGLLRSQHH